MIKKILVLLIFITIVACDSTPKDWNWGLRPRPFKGFRGFPSAKTDYGAGFKQGCEIGLNSVTKGILSSYVGNEFDPNRVARNEDFRTGWWDGYEQCVYIVDWDVV